MEIISKKRIAGTLVGAAGEGGVESLRKDRWVVDRPQLWSGGSTRPGREDPSHLSSEKVD